MDKGQHLRLQISIPVGSTIETYKVVALSTDLTFHLSAQTEDSTTKDTTDTSGKWNEYDVVGRGGDIQFTALIGSGTDTGGMTLNNIIDAIKDDIVNWKLVFVSGNENRVVGKTVCSGQGKVSNLQANGTNRQKATYSGTLTMYGPVTVGTD
jgi:hypothetical protein